MRLIILTLLVIGCSKIDNQKAQRIADKFCSQNDSKVLKIEFNNLLDVVIFCKDGSRLFFSKGDIVMGEEF